MKGAPKGNQFWKLRSKHGRDKLFKTPEELWNAVCEYFEWVYENPLYEAQLVKYKDTYELVQVPKLRVFTMQGICSYLGCNVGYFNDFEQSLKGKTDKKSKDFSAVVTCIREAVFRQKFEGAASGFFNPLLIAKDLSIKEISEITHKGLSTDDAKERLRKAGLDV